MFKKKVMLIASSLVLASSLYADAGDRLGECLVLKTSGQDRVDLMKWLNAALLAHPALSSQQYSVTEMDTIDKKTADLFTRLMTKDCKTEVENASEDGTDGISVGFAVLGQVAMQDLMVNQNVSQRMYKFVEYMDFSAFE